MNLKTSIVLRVALVATLTSIGVAYAFLAQLVEQNTREISRIAEIADRHLDFQIVNLATGMGPSANFPNWQPLKDDMNLQGLCLAYQSAAGRMTDRACIASAVGAEPAPPLFTFLARHTLDFDAAVARPVGYYQFAQGQVVVMPETDAAIARLWSQSRPVLRLLALEVVIVSLLAWIAVSRALRPTGQMLDRLARMAAGDLSIRLPASRITELNAIVAAVNQLSTKLSVTLAERADLAHRLVDSHEGERRHLARELHDELAQCLSGINARAALIALQARRICPELGAEAQAIGTLVTATLVQLRDTLVRLRPPEIDELGALQSIQRMVTRWGSDHAGIQCRFEATGDFADLPMPIGVSAFRIVQECLTNVARHAGATHVAVALSCTRAQHFRLVVADDGIGVAPQSAQAGLGLVGMRERVAALGGTIDFALALPQGLTVSATIPLTDAARRLAPDDALQALAP